MYYSRHRFVSTIPSELWYLDSEKKSSKIEIKYKSYKLMQPTEFTNDTYDNLTNKVYSSFKDIYNDNFSKFFIIHF